MIIDEIAFRSLLGKGEGIKYVGHVHPFVIYPQLFKIMFFGFIMPAGGYYLFPPFWVFWAIWGGIAITLFLYEITKWYLNVWIVTNQGIIDQDWTNYFNKSTTRIDYGNIEGVSTEIKGFWGTILRYGHIQIEHMSGEPVTLENVATPKKLERILMFHQHTYLRNQNFEDHNKLQDLLTSLVRKAGNNG